MLSWIALVPTILSSITGIINRVVPDVNEQAKIAAEIQTALIAKSAEAEKAIAEAAKAQNEVNLAEAQSPSLFVAGWRPFVGWTCGFGLSYALLVQPAITFISSLFGGPVAPTLDTNVLMSVLLGMLGLGTMRTVEKIQGVERQNMNPVPAIVNKVRRAFTAQQDGGR